MIHTVPNLIDAFRVPDSENFATFQDSTISYRALKAKQGIAFYNTTMDIVKVLRGVFRVNLAIEDMFSLKNNVDKVQANSEIL